MTIEEIRSQFSQLSQQVYGKPLVYLDSAATSLRPDCVIERWAELSRHLTSNIHRAVHFTSEKATVEYENARDAVKDFINATDRSEVIFTSGATASINLLAFSLGESGMLGKGDTILLAESEHHSDIVPWQMLCNRKGCKIKILPVEEDGTYDLGKLRSLLDPSVKLCCIAQVSNVLGQENPIKDVVDICHSSGCLVMVDGAQGIVHCGADVQDLGCDFYVFSGHKIYAATGVGVLFCRREIAGSLQPWQGGGEMIDTVTWEKTTYASSPLRFEAGTPNFTGVPTLVPALKLWKEMGRGEGEEITEYLLRALPELPGLKLYGTCAQTKLPVFSFAVDGAHHEDIALVLDKMGIAVRSGEMCAAPLMRRFGITGMVRASFAPYNTLEEAHYFVKSLSRAINMLTK